MSIAIATGLHILAAVIWVGGMFFAVFVLRPSTGALEPETRLALWGRTFERFFPWVWASIGLLLASGYWIIFAGKGGFQDMPMYLHLMQGIGWVMILIYLHLWFGPYGRFRKAVADGDVPTAGKNLNTIRILVTVNLWLGLTNAAFGVAGRYWG